MPNFGNPGPGAELKPGMVLAIEPMVTLGALAVRILEDGWTAVTAGREPAAHFEHTIAITDDGPRVLPGRSAAPPRRRAVGWPRKMRSRWRAR